ncbi:MAG: acyl-CoA thioesterase [Eubacteriales bacterium]|nr:acyl-CoA thioesterase [Eubacteriales bacterium]
MRAYKHIVQYYETDKMGITHHSNYIRWMEEARVDYLQQIGWDYAKLEELGIISPVVSVDCQYKNTTTFSDEILIDVSVTEFKGIKLVLHYEMKNKDGKVVCEANSSHCFLDQNGRPIRLSKQFPEFNEKLLSLVS